MSRRHPIDMGAPQRHSPRMTRPAWAGLFVIALGLVAGPARALADEATLIMGGTGDPDPNAAYLAEVDTAYILPSIAPQTATPTALATPEQGYPVYVACLPLSGLRTK